MRLPIYTAAVGVAISLLVLGGIFAVRPRKSAACPFILSTAAHPLFLNSTNDPRLSKRLASLNEKLLIMAANRDIAEAKRCLEAGADINVFEDDSKYFTPLTYAGYSGDAKMMRFLLANGADPNAFAINSPLYWTISMGKANCVRILLDAGADPWDKYIDEIPIEYAVADGQLEITRTLIGYMPQLTSIQKRDYLQKAKNEALFNAVSEGTLSEIKKLVEDGANVNYKEGVGEPTLMEAVSRGDVPILSYLLAQGANVNMRNIQDRTPLMFMGKADRYYGESTPTSGAEIARLLFLNGAKAGLRDMSGKTALMYAAQDNAKAMKVLLEHGEQLRAHDNFGRTALHYAAEVRDEKSLEILLRQGAQIDAQDEQGVTALMLASVNPSQPFTAADRSSRLKCLDLLQRYKANPLLQNKEGENAAAYARMEDDDFVSAS